MRSKEVLKILKITRQTLCSYVKSGVIRATKNTKGWYNYFDEDVYGLIGLKKGKNNTKNVIYTTNQYDTLFQFCTARGIFVDMVYTKLSRADLVYSIVRGEINTIILESEHSISTDFHLFKLFTNCYKINIIVANPISNDNNY